MRSGHLRLGHRRGWQRSLQAGRPFWREQREGIRCIRGSQDFITTACTLLKASDLTTDAFEIAVENKTSYYDSLFLAAARDGEMPLLTLDRKLYEKVKAKKDVRIIVAAIKELKSFASPVLHNPQFKALIKTDIHLQLDPSGCLHAKELQQLDPHPFLLAAKDPSDGRFISWPVLLPVQTAQMRPLSSPLDLLESQWKLYIRLNQIQNY